MTNLGGLLSPRSIAIVGLSADPTKHSRRTLHNLTRLGFSGEIWGVNPSRPRLDDVDVFARLGDLPAPPDVVISTVPASAVCSVVREAAAIEAPTVVIFAGGFAEAGESGRSMQHELSAVIDETGVRVLGPNSGGVIVPSSRLAMSFLTCLDRPTTEIRSGPVGIVTQSGGIGSYLHNLAAGSGRGLAASISTGNEVDIGVAEGIVALAEFDEVRAIGVILETVRKGDPFIDAVRQAHDAGKRVVVTRIGWSTRGRRLMQTHTGALGRPARVLDGVLASLGVTVAETPQEMFEICEILARAPTPMGRRVGVVTHSGGIAIMLSDLAERTAIDIPPLGPALRETLEPLLAQGSLDNPLDMGSIIGGAHRFGEVVEGFVDSGDFDVVLSVSTAHPPAHTRQRVEALLAVESDVPVVHLWMAGDVGDEGLEAMRAAGVPVTEEPRAAIRALGALVDTTQSATPTTCDEVGIAQGPLTEFAAKGVVRDWGFPVVEGGVATTADEAVGAADRLGYPVVVKVSSPDIDHKTEVGGVLVGRDNAASVGAAFRQVVAAVEAAAPQATIEGALVERHIEGPEVIIGAMRDEVFGPMALIGIGGVVAEGLDDARMAPAPIAATHARRMIDSLSGLTLLTRPRRGAPADLDGLALLLVMLADRFAIERSISSVDLNPVVWSGSEWFVLDATIQRGDSATATPDR